MADSASGTACARPTKRSSSSSSRSWPARGLDSDVTRATCAHYRRRRVQRRPGGDGRRRARGPAQLGHAPRPVPRRPTGAASTSSSSPRRRAARASARARGRRPCGCFAAPAVPRPPSRTELDNERAAALYRKHGLVDGSLQLEKHFERRAASSSRCSAARRPAIAGRGAASRRCAAQPGAHQPRGHVGAVGLLGQVVAGALVGARPAAAADPLVLAGAAFALERVEVAQLGEQRRLVARSRRRSARARCRRPCRSSRRAAPAPTCEMKQKPTPARQPRLERVHAAVGVRVHGELAALRLGALTHDPPVVRHVGRLEEQRARAAGRRRSSPGCARSRRGRAPARPAPCRARWAPA